MTVSQLFSNIHLYPDVVSYCDMTGDIHGCICKNSNGAYNGIETKNFLLKYRNCNIEDFDIYIDDVEGVILCISFDVAEAKHGKWEYRKIFKENEYGTNDYKGYVCSICGGIEPVNSRFCPNCGADMTGW